MVYADIILPVPLDGFFTYAVTDAMQGRVVEGMRVLVPFGRNKHYVGVVAKLHQQKPQGYQIKEISQILDEQPILLPGQLKFWQWISDYYMSPNGEV